MNEVPFHLLFGAIGLVVGGFVGLNYSYNKYNLPYAIKKIDSLALICSISGAIILLVNLPYYLNYIIGAPLLGIPFGMRPGYGNIELYVGLIILTIGILLKSLLL
ncbi:DUF2104 domain-containing protein [Methanococcus aeolicus]|uniref:Uncharacterized protein n=1 Tax=Methanococcus aeolicus (strain ATCC BAA-1280 / DSM 17508 / OCM 812 / Nankai-3) TaxID=419665 RepID=A6UTY3_META3|nr:DUF2104 domain-containing protein [Methanococcus aeolicus]ABR55955.1 conserved hypothetical protein [Methanococcus aeolicus Nankai-3]UXM85447.1 DUF2104 domain-containing protein [Methanococcus aeolicus]